MAISKWEEAEKASETLHTMADDLVDIHQLVIQNPDGTPLIDGYDLHEVLKQILLWKYKLERHARIFKAD